MDKRTAEMIANELRIEVANNPLHFGSVEIEVVDTVGAGWMVQIY